MNDNYDWIKEKYKDILEIYPRKCLNTQVLNAKLLELQKEYNLVQIFPDWIRAFKK
jgi:hypothetical protein